MLTLALIVALAQTPQHRLFQQPNLPQATGEAAAFFEFAPTNGAGMGAACACTTPTGAKGEVMTYTRASNGTCTKTATGGLVTTGIANGDLVVCSTNQPRVTYDGAGYLGLLVESARTNSTLRSQELENVVWASNNSGIALPTVTANATTAPDGTVTADRLQIPGSTTAGHYSQLFQLSSCPSGAAAQIASVYLRGVSGSGSVCLKIGTNVATCNYVSGSWSRCTPSINAAASTTLALSVDVTACGANATGVDVYVWGMQCENSGAYVTSYIPTAGTAVARAYDNAYFNVSLASLASNGSSAASVDQPKLFDSAAINLTTTVNAIGVLAPYLQNVTTVAVYSGGIVAGQAVSNMSTSNQRLGSSWTGTTFSSHYNGNTVSGTGSAFSASNDVIQLCDYNTSHACDGIVSRVCVDTSSSRCR